MANRNFANSRMYSMHVMPVVIDCNVAIGASGATSDLIGPLVTSVTRLAAGIYRVTLQDKYNKLFNIKAICAGDSNVAPTTAGSFVATTPYKIVTLGTTNYNLIGVPAGTTPAVGMSFVATGVGAGTGTASAITASQIVATEIISPLMNPDAATLQGSSIIIQTLGVTAVDDATLIPKDPANGSRLFVEMYLSNSSIVIAGE